MNEEILNFLEKYQEMRAAQKEYFKNKQYHALVRSKQLEVALDGIAAGMKGRISGHSVPERPTAPDPQPQHYTDAADYLGLYGSPEMPSERKK